VFLIALLPIARELRRMKAQDDNQKFSEAFSPFAAKHSKAVWDEVLKPRLEALGDNNWKPKCWSEGVGYQSEVYRILRQRFEDERLKHFGRKISTHPNSLDCWGCCLALFS
jgi:hypothetical protein